MGPVTSTPIAAVRGPRSWVVPPERTLLKWLYIGRISVAAAVFLAAALSWWRADLTALLVASLSVTAALVVTAASYWYSHLGAGAGAGGAGQTFLYGQALFDVALVTAIVHISGPYSYFAALYILVITAYTLLMPFANALLVALLAGIAYTADVILGRQGELSAAVLLQVAVYWLVASAAGYLASRLRVMGTAHETLAAELQRVRLEAADILRHIGAGVLTVAGDGTLVYANPTAETMLGLPRGMHRDRPVLEQVDQVAPVLGEAIRRSAREGRRVVRTVADVATGGRSFPIGFTTTLLRTAEGDAPSVTAIFQDISDARRLEELRLRTERLEAVAELSASLAHEIKNPLASIRSAVTQLSRFAAPGADERVLAGLIVRESDRLSALLTEFLDFSRVRVTRSVKLDLVAVAEHGIGLARQHPDCTPKATILLEAAERPVLIEGDEDLLHRVVFNLVLNAVQAASAAAEVRVQVGPAASGDLPAGVVMDAPQVLRVSDAGPGVAAELLPRIFEPFVTGRPGGSGLGLAIVQRAVQAHRGLIFCETVPGRGTTFSVFLPARFAAEEAAPAEPALSGLPSSAPPALHSPLRGTTA
jgi:two-component system sensor histidine kinase PilS (NtrC family)